MQYILQVDWLEIAVSGFEFVDGLIGTGQKQSAGSVFEAMGDDVEINF